jgi:DnaJ-class molecular chaperone
VASEQTDNEDDAKDAHEPRECMPCRGSGQVISNLGGTAKTVSCPWCGGGGVRVADVDAQASWRDGDANDAPADQAPPDSAA